MAHYLDDRSANEIKRWTTPSRLEAEMVAAAELIMRGLAADEAARFASIARRTPVHTAHGSDPDRLPRKLSLRIYWRLWRWRLRKQSVTNVVERNVR